MGKRDLISFLAVLAAISLASAQTAGTGTGAGTSTSGSHAGAVHAGATNSHSTGSHGGQHQGTGKGGPSAGVGHVVLPPGWGLAPPTGFGDVNHPGGVTGNTVPPFLQPLPMTIQPMPNAVQPLVGFFQPGTSDPGGPGGRKRHRNGLDRGVVPIGIPIFVPYGGYYAPPPAQEAQGPAEMPTQGSGYGPGVWGGSEPPAATGASNQGSSNKDAAPASNPVTLLVFKDHSIYAVTDYWVEQDRLHYVTSYGASNSVPLDQLDLEFTRKLNEERNIKFELKKN